MLLPARLVPCSQPKLIVAFKIYECNHMAYLEYINFYPQFTPRMYVQTVLLFKSFNSSDTELLRPFTTVNFIIGFTLRFKGLCHDDFYSAKRAFFHLVEECFYLPFAENPVQGKLPDLPSTQFLTVLYLVGTGSYSWLSSHRFISRSLSQCLSPDAIMGLR